MLGFKLSVQFRNGTNHSLQYCWLVVWHSKVDISGCPHWPNCTCPGGPLGTNPQVPEPEICLAVCTEKCEALKNIDTVLMAAREVAGDAALLSMGDSCGEQTALGLRWGACGSSPGNRSSWWATAGARWSSLDRGGWQFPYCANWRSKRASVHPTKPEVHQNGWFKGEWESCPSWFFFTQPLHRLKWSHSHWG